MTIANSGRQCVLGIDPGLRIAGYAVIGCEGGRARLEDLGFLQQSSSDALVERVGRFYQLVRGKCAEFGVTDIALETPFLGKNTQTFLKLGYLRGSLYVVAHELGLALHEFAPCQVKQAVTGSGRAEKDQVARALSMLFPRIAEIKATVVNDVTDALGVALCGALALSIDPSKRRGIPGF
jgi:crossover junction endodeoxyribonuclease RuvC